MNSCDGGASATWGPVDGGKAMGHARTMVGHGPRPSGSPELALTQAYIVSELKKLGLVDFGHKWKDPTQPKVRYFRNIVAQIDGEEPVNGPILILAAHYDTKLCKGHSNPDHNFHFVGAIDGAGGPATLLELARHLKTRKSVPNIWLLFIDGEESIPFDWKDDQALYGSRYFVKKMGADKKRFPNSMSTRVRAFVLIDLIGSKNLKIDRDKASNTTLNNLFKEAATGMGESARMYETTSTMTDDHIPFKKAGMRVIDLIDFNYRAPDTSADQSFTDPRYEQWWHTKKDNLDAMDPESLAFVGNLLWNAISLLEAKFYPKKK